MAKLRKSFEEGHSRKFLVIIDDTEECSRAVAYAAKRAERTFGTLTMLYIISPSEFQHWLGVEKIMRAEAHERANEMFDTLDWLARSMAPSIRMEHAIREGAPGEVIPEYIEEDEDVGILVLAAGTGKEGPGPLVSSMAGISAGTFPVPVTIVPGTLTDQDIAALA